MFANIRVPHPPSFNEADVSDKPQWVRALRPLTPKQIARLDEIYRDRLELLQAVDDMLEALVNELQRTGQLGRTYIFFTSDNGLHLGEHRLRSGKATAYEEDIHVPLIVRGPGVSAGRTVPHLALNIDFAPTFAELAGVQAPSWVDGRSLVPVWRATPPSLDAWRQAFLVEHYNVAENPDESWVKRWLKRAIRLVGARRRPPVTPEMRAMRTRDYTYIEYATGERELYDLHHDPYELQNIAATADPELLKALTAELAALRRCAGVTCRGAEDTWAPALVAR
jgi:arylsulfatase A-like enzyme